jgi:multidrug resistance efflux pump
VSTLLVTMLAAASVLLPSGDPEVLDLEGVFVEHDPVVIAYRPEAYTGEIEVLEAVTSGPVEKGQMLVRLCSTNCDEKIAQAELDLVTARTRLLRLQEEAQRAEETSQLEFLQADLRVVDAERALVEKVTIDAPRRLFSSEDRVRNLEVVREEAEEEFRVLVRVYEADEVIEDAERISMESRRRRLERGNLLRPHVIARYEILRDITIPREIVKLEHAVRKAKHARDLLRATSALRLAQARHELSKSELAFRRQQESFEKLARDREALTIKAPVDGIAIAGSYRGRWTSLDESARRLRPGARVSPDQVLFTIVQSAPRIVRASIPENRLFEISVGQEATLVPTAVPLVSLPATVIRIVPYSSDGQHEVWLCARTRHERLFPGSTCRVKIARKR